MASLQRRIDELGTFDPLELYKTHAPDFKSLCDIQAAFARFPGTEFTIDGAHLNNAGARLTAEVLAEHVR